jgi:acyl carrier protein
VTDQNPIDEVRDCIAKCLVLDIEKLSAASKIGEFPEWDSLGHIRIFFAIQDRFSITIPLELAGDARSVGDWAAAVRKSSGY